MGVPRVCRSTWISQKRSYKGCQSNVFVFGKNGALVLGLILFAPTIIELATAASCEAVDNGMWGWTHNCNKVVQQCARCSGDNMILAWSILETIREQVPTNRSCALVAGVVNSAKRVLSGVVTFCSSDEFRIEMEVAGKWKCCIVLNFLLRECYGLD